VSSSARSCSRPSPRRGARRAFAEWRLVLLVWLLPYLLLAPALLVVELGLVRHLKALPAASTSLQDGLLILAAALPAAGPSLAVTVLAGLLLLWLWTVLWHAGLAQRQHRAGTAASGQGAAAGELLSLGTLAFWPFFRLSLTALASLGLGLLAIGAPLEVGVAQAREAMAEVAMEWMLACGLLGAVLLLATCWCASLGGAWRIASDPRHSALRSWWRGLGASLRNPLSSFGTLGLWGMAAFLLALAPLVLGAAASSLRGGPGGWLVAAGTGLGRGFSEVALFLSFAPESADGRSATLVARGSQALGQAEGAGLQQPASARP
jgi:hypothetical protein